MRLRIYSYETFQTKEFNINTAKALCEKVAFRRFTLQLATVLQDLSVQNSKINSKTNNKIIPTFVFILSSVLRALFSCFSNTGILSFNICP